MSETVNSCVHQSSFEVYNSDGTQSGDMVVWTVYFEDVQENRQCRLYIVREEVSPEKYYIQFCQGPRPLGDYALPAEPHSPPPPPDMDENWFTLVDLQFSDYEDYVENASYKSSIEGFTKSSTDYLFQATVDTDSDDWGAPVLLTVDEQ